MRILFLIFFLTLAIPAAAADSATQPADKATQASPQAKAADVKKDDAAKADSAPKAAPNAQAGEYACKYYSVKLPEGWKAIIPPTDQQGATNAIFSSGDGSSVVTMIVGLNGGEDAQTIATMFAEQFKSKNKPSAIKNGQYSFNFQSQNTTAQAYVATQDKVFMVTTIMGNIRQGREFLAKNVTSENFAALLPK